MHFCIRSLVRISTYLMYRMEIENSRRMCTRTTGGSLHTFERAKFRGRRRARRYVLRRGIVGV